jgi:hypothetical protein
MIAVDTNVLARFYCDDPDDPEARRQRPLARRTMLDSAAIFVSSHCRARARMGHARFLRARPRSILRGRTACGFREVTGATLAAPIGRKGPLRGAGQLGSCVVYLAASRCA